MTSKILNFPKHKTLPAGVLHESDVEAPKKPDFVRLPSNWRAYNATKYVKDVCSKQTREELQALMNAWPNLYEATLRLGMQITSQFPGRDGESLLALVIKGALEKYEENGASRTLNLNAQLAYLAELISCAEEILGYIVLGMTKSGDVLHWSPFKQPLSQWIRHNDIVSLRFEETNEYDALKQDAKKLLAHEILDTEDMLILSKSAGW